MVQVLQVLQLLRCFLAFWQISLMRLLNFTLQSKVVPSSFSLRELFTCKSTILSVLGSCLFISI